MKTIKTEELKHQHFIYPSEDKDERFFVAIAIEAQNLNLPKEAEELTAEFYTKLIEILNAKK